MLEAASSLLSATCTLANNSESTSSEYFDSAAADILVVKKKFHRKSRLKKPKKNFRPSLHKSPDNGKRKEIGDGLRNGPIHVGDWLYAMLVKGKRSGD